MESDLPLVLDSLQEEQEVAAAHLGTYTLVAHILGNMQT